MKQKGLTAQEYETLVNELMKDRPNQNLIRRLLIKQGVPYTADPISQMSLVLQSLNQQAVKPKDL